MDYFLLDNWDLATREVQPGGYSQIKRRGEWELESLPRCLGCGKEVWPLIVKYPFRAEFSGAKIGDITFGFATTLVVSERFRTLWQGSGLDGLIFSDYPLDVKFKKKVEFDTPSREFFAAYPEPEFVRLAEQSRAVYSEDPECPTCAVGVVESVDRLLFETDGPLTDFFLPSALPGWFVVSQRVRDFVEENHLQNFQFVEGFSRKGWQLVRHGYWKFGAGGQLERHGDVSFPAHV